MIEVNRFCKIYDQTIAVRDLTFHVRPGQVLGLVGRNGAGKTTTLRCLTGIIPSSSGELKVDGYDINQNPLEVKQRTAYVPDDPQLFSDLSVEQHLKFQASVYGIDDPSEDISQLLSMFELEDKRHTAASGLSRGMRQKLAISCAYLQKPKALLLDEPMTGLDPQAIRVLKSSIIEKSKAGVAIIISSHLLAMVEDICSDFLVLNFGKQKFFGSLTEIQKKFNAGNAPQIDASSLEQAFFSALSDVQETVTKGLSPERILAPSSEEDQTNSSTDPASTQS